MDGRNCSLFLPSCPRLQNTEPAIKSCKQAPRNDTSNSSGSECSYPEPGNCIPRATAPICLAEVKRPCLAAAAEMTDPTRNEFSGSMTRSKFGSERVVDRTSYKNKSKATPKGSWDGFRFLNMIGASGESRRRTRDWARTSAREGLSMVSDSYNSAIHETVSLSGRCLTTCKRVEAALTGSERESLGDLLFHGRTQRWTTMTVFSQNIIDLCFQ